MRQEITDGQTIAEVQEQFHYIFPFLKIDFFEKDLSDANKTNKPVVNTGRLLGEFRPAKNETSSIWLDKFIKVNELERYINSTYRLQAQVFRRSRNVWLETTITNNWTLEEQNKQGEMLTMKTNDTKVE